jgi:sec-independent protein translocase protein TatB
MDFFGIGIQEILLIVLIALIVLGPKDMVKAGRALGKVLRKTIFSPTWMNVQRTVRNLPYQLAREAGLEEMDLQREMNEVQSEIQQSIHSMQAEVRQEVQAVNSDLQQVDIDGASREYVQDLRQTSRESQYAAEWTTPPQDPAADQPASAGG